MNDEHRDYWSETFGASDAGDFDRAIRIATEGINLDLAELSQSPQDYPYDLDMGNFEIYTVVNLLVLRSTVYDFMKNHDAVIADLTLVFELCHRYPQRFGRRYQDNMADYYWYRGWHYFLKGAYSEAVADFDEAIRRKTNVVDWYLIRARARYLLGNKMGAEDDARQAQGLSDNVTHRAMAQFILDTLANNSPW